MIMMMGGILASVEVRMDISITENCMVKNTWKTYTLRGVHIHEPAGSHATSARNKLRDFSPSSL